MNISRNLVICFLFFCWLIYSCKDYYRNKSNAAISTSSIRNGEQLAVKYCQSCHMLPDPALLDAKTWDEGVLPHMGPRLGIFDFFYRKYPSARNDEFLSKNFYPSKPLLRVEEWTDLVNYYTATSPDTLPKQPAGKGIKTGLSLFEVQEPKYAFPSPSVTFIKIDESHGGQLIVCDATKNMYTINKGLEIIDSVSTPGIIVDIDFGKESLVACNIGFMNPTNGKFGQSHLLQANSLGKMAINPSPIFANLQRPIQITSSDLNSDGAMDYLVCEFGNLDGALSWMENLGENKFKRHVLRATPGATKVIVQDINKDGLPDFWVLFAQGDERIILFQNEGKGQFSQQEILQFPPAYGSTYFELVDFNKDGFQDIIYTCGDNSDYSQILKPYHGVYIYLNDTKNRFVKKVFFPINGCYKAMARDYDGDGDLDIAAISFFADYLKKPEEGFVYLQNNGKYNFEPLTAPEATKGRWLTMDVGDFNVDGKIDIVLGNFSVAPTMIKSNIDWQKGPPFLMLKNIGSQGK